MSFQRVEVMIAMGVAGAINMSMLIIAASLFHDSGLVGVDSIEGAHAAFGDLVGPGAALAFALALLASGFAASSVGTYAGQVVMQGFINRTSPLVLLTRRRSIMGGLVNRPLTTTLASVVAALIIALNGFLLFQTFA
jgi:manganese transport protein